MPVVFIPGNHEFYGDSFVEGMEEAREEAHRYPGVHLLDRDEVVLARARFLGAILWTDYCLGAATAKDIAWAMSSAQTGMRPHALRSHLQSMDR